MTESRIRRIAGTATIKVNFDFTVRLEEGSIVTARKINAYSSQVRRKIPATIVFIGNV